MERDVNLIEKWWHPLRYRSAFKDVWRASGTYVLPVGLDIPAFHERQRAAKKIVGLIDEACDPGAARRDPKRAKVLRAKLDDHDFLPVYIKAEKLFLKRIDPESKHPQFDQQTRRLGRDVLEAAARFGLGSKVIHWRNVVAEIMTSTEGTSSEKPIGEEGAFLRSLVSRQEGKEGVDTLYQQTADQVAQRAIELSADTSAEGRLKMRRMYGLLAEGVTFQNLLDGNPKDDTEDLNERAYGVARERCESLQPAFHL